MKKTLLSLITITFFLCEASFPGGGMAFAETFDYTYSSKEYTCTILTDTESSKTVSIAAKSGATFSGSVSIPSSAKNTATNKTYSVTAITKQGFKDKSSITSISIPSTVTAIGYQAFYGINISSITIPENVEIAGEDMVRNCSNLTSIIWNAKNCTKCYNSSNSAADWGSSTNPFYGTPRSNVTSFTFGNKVQTIPAYICYNFSKIEKITLPASVTTIGNYAFQNCTGLVEFYVAPKSPVTMYSSYMLSGCTKLEKINISKAVTSLGERAFYNCSALQYIFAQASSAPSVGTNALSNVPTSTTKLQMLTSDSYSSYNSTSPWNTFTNRNWISSYTITYDSKHTLTMLSHDDDNDTLYVSTQVKSGVTLSSGSVTLPPEYTSSGGLYYGYRVKPTTIVDNAYKNQTSITGVTIGDSYSSIGASAFQGCSSLATVSVGKNITSVGSSAFASTAITSVTWNALNCPDFGSYSTSPFYGRRTSITSFTISTSIKHIPAYLCYGMNALTGTSSTSRTFYGSLKSIGTYAFYGCSSMTSISFSNASSLKTIGASAFQSCSNVTSSISIPASVESIGASAFSGCSKLAGLTFNKKASLKTIGGSAFSGCSKISGALFIPDSVISLGTNTFYNCTTLVSVEFGKGTQIELLDKWVFQNCSGLKYVVIPATVDSIADLAFDGCIGLEYLVSKPTTPPGVVTTSSHTFKNVSRTIPIYVANTTAANKYKVARGWSEFYAANENAFATYMGGSGEEYKCGDDLYWQLNLADGTLSFTGSGDMYNYDNSSNKAPWRAYDYFLGSLSLNNSSMTSIGNYAFYSCTGLLGSLNISSSITSIGERAFDYCEGFTSLTMSPASIGIWAFGYCKGLKSVTINDGLTVLPKDLFDGCYALETVKLPSTLEKIRDDAFYNCSTIVAMHIPASVDSIGTRSFSGCRGLQYIKSDNPTPPLAVSASFTNVPKTIPICVPSAEAIEDYKVAAGWKDYFTDLSVFGQVIIGTCNESINWRIDFSDGTLTVYGSGDMPNYTSNTMPWFEYNQDVRQIVVEEGITTIGKFAFYGMPEVVSISLPEGLTTVSASAFSSNTGRDITELTLPSTLTSIGEYAFSGLSHLTKINVLSSSSTPATMTVSKTGYSDYDYLNFASSAFNNAVLVLPNVSNPVVYSTASGWRKFLHHGGYCGAGEGGTNQTWDYNTSTHVLTISGTGNMADYNYTGDNVSPWYAYRSLYTSVRVEHGVEHLGAYAFRDCSELSIVHLPASINAMSGNVFSICNSLTDYTYAGTLAQWFNINFATLTGSPIYITHKFYLNGEYPSSLTIPNSITTVPENAFYGCTSLTSVVLSEGIERIEDQAFQGCSEMVSITLPRSLRFVGTRGLYSMAKLENINYNGTSGDWCRIAFEAGTSHPLYNNVNATLYCNGELPTEVLVPNDVTAIGQYQFYKVSSLESLTLHSNVKSIGTYAFYNCSNLASVTSQATIPPTIQSSTFSNASSKTLYVPHSVSVKAAYRAASGWSSFTEANTFPKIVQFDLNGQTGDAIDPQYFDNLTSKASVPSDPADDGYFVFDKWCSDEEGESPFNFASMNITADMTLFAKWGLNGTLALSETDDNSTKLSDYNGSTVDVNLTRSLTNAQYNTFCLPFSLSAEVMTEKFGAGYDLEELTDVAYNAGELTLEFTKRDELEAGKPYLLQPANNVSNPSFTGVEIDASTPSDGLDNTFIEFHGVYSPTELTGGNKNLLFLGAGNELFWPSSTGDLKGFRAYFEVKGSAQKAVRARIVKKEDTATGIDQITNDQLPITNKFLRNGQLLILRDGKTYNAQGMLVE